MNPSKEDLKSYGGYVGLAMEAVLNSQGETNMRNNVRATFESALNLKEQVNTGEKIDFEKEMLSGGKN